ncbi:hypothetical protein SAMN02744133_10824 [Thalassospira xiamenensis M-5 = DSM 17429]|uniref:Uncharacterized protein n=1 Tax=Thalassospira xiamenensis M-5 = DSM 17429 TaxID=1123366 RepID=A0AB72UJD1_9PROT|nr:hypothetical protein [Thalassospira xiamenensis]AJD54303.1 hypothetical protein TH3_21153 [Thalassospira xiamenensis M-5 = DSM 17429]SIT20985.1 hypothetical protein SAMN02744133_10824 [Thalassospira xiamenensis M-5 = DSM 17429]
MSFPKLLTELDGMDTPENGLHVIVNLNSRRFYIQSFYPPIYPEDLARASKGLEAEYPKVRFLLANSLPSLEIDGAFEEFKAAYAAAFPDRDPEEQRLHLSI